MIMKILWDVRLCLIFGRFEGYDKRGLNAGHCLSNVKAFLYVVYFPDSKLESVNQLIRDHFLTGILCTICLIIMADHYSCTLTPSLLQSLIFIPFNSWKVLIMITWSHE